MNEFPFDDLHIWIVLQSVTKDGEHIPCVIHDTRLPPLYGVEGVDGCSRVGTRQIGSWREALGAQDRGATQVSVNLEFWNFGILDF